MFLQKPIMEGEINNFIMVWTTTVACLCYCHTISKLFPKPNFLRAFAILPVSVLFLVLPLNLNSVNLAATSSFFIAWLGSFKLFLFAFGYGPLASSPPFPLFTFIPLACLPIKFQSLDKSVKSDSPKKTPKSTFNLLTKFMLLVLLIRVYKYQEFLHPNLVMFLYCFHIYFSLETILAAVNAAVGAVARFQLEPPFDEPHLATSLQDFWGRRWNLMVTNILRPAVYLPVRSAAERVLPPRAAEVPAVVATFLVSGLMHELIFYNIGRVKPSGEVMCFFLLHGVCLVLEIWAKRKLNGKFRLPGFVSGPLALAFVVLTSFSLFFPPFLKNKADVKACSECIALVQSIKQQKLVSPNNITCPFF